MEKPIDDICDHFNPDDGVECPEKKDLDGLCCYACPSFGKCPNGCKDCCDPGSNIGG